MGVVGWRVGGGVSVEWREGRRWGRVGVGVAVGVAVLALGSGAVAGVGGGGVSVVGGFDVDALGPAPAAFPADLDDRRWYSERAVLRGGRCPEELSATTATTFVLTERGLSYVLSEVEADEGQRRLALELASEARAELERGAVGFAERVADARAATPEGSTWPGEVVRSQSDEAMRRLSRSVRERFLGDLALVLRPEQDVVLGVGVAEADRVFLAERHPNHVFQALDPVVLLGGLGVSLEEEAGLAEIVEVYRSSALPLIERLWMLSDRAHELGEVGRLYYLSDISPRGTIERVPSVEESVRAAQRLSSVAREFAETCGRLARLNRNTLEAIAAELSAEEAARLQSRAVDEARLVARRLGYRFEDGRRMLGPLRSDQAFDVLGVPGVGSAFARLSEFDRPHRGWIEAPACGWAAVHDEEVLAELTALRSGFTARRDELLRAAIDSETGIVEQRIVGAVRGVKMTDFVSVHVEMMDGRVTVWVDHSSFESAVGRVLDGRSFRVDESVRSELEALDRRTLERLREALPMGLRSRIAGI